jgi:hypothetical protein
MYDLWVEDIATKEAWRLDHDATKKVYIDAEGKTIYKCQIHEVRFYPCCPKAAPKNKTIEHGKQLNIFDYIEGVS